MAMAGLIKWAKKLSPSTGSIAEAFQGVVPQIVASAFEMPCQATFVRCGKKYNKRRKQSVVSSSHLRAPARLSADLRKSGGQRIPPPGATGRGQEGRIQFPGTAPGPNGIATQRANVTLLASRLGQQPFSYHGDCRIFLIS